MPRFAGRGRRAGCGIRLRALAWSLLIATGFTLAIALGGLILGWNETRTFDPAAYRGWFIPHDLQEPRRFLCAGYMHNAAYLGGALSIVAVWLFNVVFRSRNAQAL